MEYGCHWWDLELVRLFFLSSSAVVETLDNHSCVENPRQEEGEEDWEQGCREGESFVRQ